MKKKILISHIDLDGHGIITLAKYFNNIIPFDDIITEDYDFHLNEKTFEYISLFDEIVIADLSLPEEYLNTLQKNSKVFIFDHHSNTQWIDSYDNCVWDDTRAGTKIFWEEYIKPKLSRYKPIIEDFVNLVDIYDRWQQESELWLEAKNLNNLLYGMRNYYGSDEIEKSAPFYDSTILKFNKLNNWRWTDKESFIIKSALNKEIEAYNEAIGNLKIRKDYKGLIFGICSYGTKISIVASMILEDKPKLDYLIVVNSWKGISGKLSIRSRKGFNCTLLATVEGHEAAAATMLTPEQANYLLNNLVSISYQEEYNINNEMFHLASEV